MPDIKKKTKKKSAKKIVKKSATKTAAKTTARRIIKKKKVSGPSIRSTPSKKTTTRTGSKRVVRPIARPLKGARKPAIQPNVSEADLNISAIAAAKAASDKKAVDVVVLDVRGHSAICDFVVVAGARNTTHLMALGDSVEEKMRSIGERCIHRDGQRSAEPTWVLLDYGDVMIHLMLSEARSRYQIEELYPEAKLLARYEED